jgi:hypothetical protein
VGKLITEATPEQRGVLIEEPSAYIEARGHTTDWLDIVIGQAVPEFGAARTQLRKAQQALIVTRSNAESLRKTFKQEGHRPVLVNTTRRSTPRSNPRRPRAQRALRGNGTPGLRHPVSDTARASRKTNSPRRAHQHQPRDAQ